MRRVPSSFSSSTFLFCVGALATPWLASAAPTSTAAAELKAQLKEELRQELLDELKAELQAEGAKPAAPAADQWAAEEWKWEEPAKPELSFFEIDGYFRFRYEMFKGLDLGIANREPGGDWSGAFSPGLPPNVPLCRIAGTCRNSDTIGGANMRLRLEPTMNISEDIKLKMQIDVLDNLVLGSTAEGFPTAFGVPLPAFAQQQLPPSFGLNALRDSVRVKRVWAEVMTPFGQLRVGRMGSQFGMGMLANDGSGLEANHGDNVDRIMFATKLAGHYIVPMFDWAVSGPTSEIVAVPSGQPFDRDQRDDVDQFALAVLKRDKDAEIKEKLENDEWVLNYGVYGVYRTQSTDSADYFKNSDPKDAGQTSTQVVRNAQLFVGAAWAKFLYRKLSIEAEAVGITGNAENEAVGGLASTFERGFDIRQWGAAIRGEYKFLSDALTVRLLVAAASGDSAPGWGVYPLGNTDPKAGAWDGIQQANGSRRSINNYRFDPDFFVDLILWRQIIGTLTDGLVIRPGVQYNFTEQLGARLDFVYSRAMYAASTPSGSYSYDESDDQLDASGVVTKVRNPNPNLGVEADARIFLQTDDGFNVWLQYGILFPLAGLDRRVASQGILQSDGTYLSGGPADLSSTLAQTLQLMFAVTY